MKYFPGVRPRLALPIPLMVLLLAACWGGGAGKKPVGPTVPTEAPPTSTTAPPDVSTVPAVIDEAYLNEVLKALNKVDGDATRMIVANQELVPAAAERLRAVYAGEELNDQLRLWNEQVSAGLEEFRSPPGDRKTRITRILTAGPTCTFVMAEHDFSAVAKQPPPPGKSFIGLRPKDPREDAGGYNQTPWSIAFEAVSVGGADPDDPCAG